MTRDEILNMAREAKNSKGYSIYPDWWDSPTYITMLERFANLVEQRTMQECAKICETVAKHYDEDTGYKRNDVECVPQDGCDDCAEAIRAAMSKDKQ